ncbi:30S ribosomal protein S27ae [Nitrosopumilus sp.]|nr:30S ribosomal protein S27ae [Nitrosopumilus sp.]
MPVEKKGNKGSSPKVYGYYKVDGDKVTRTRKNCIRCGKGVYMSEHKDRRTCGKCGDTEFIQ